MPGAPAFSHPASTTADVLFQFFDHFTLVDTSANPVTVTLGDPARQPVQVVKDFRGNAAANPITIHPGTYAGPGSDQIDGLASVVIAVNYGVFRGFWNGGSWSTW